MFCVFILWCHTRGFAFRNSGVQQAGDTLHRLLLFWMMFLPSNEHFSIDSYINISMFIIDTSFCSFAVKLFPIMLRLLLFCCLFALTIACQEQSQTKPTSAKEKVYKKIQVKANRLRFAF